MKNKEKFSKEIMDLAIRGQNFGISKCTNEINCCDNFDCSNCLFCGKRYPKSCQQNKLEWANKEYKDNPKLNETEKEYLLNIIKPFKDLVIGIEKLQTLENDCARNSEYIVITHRRFDIWDDINRIYLPAFKANTMYKGIDCYRQYTLEELGL